MRSSLCGRCASNHRAVLDRGRRRGYVRSDVCRAERAVRHRLDADRVGHLRALESGRSEMDPATVDGLAVRENLAVNCSHGADVMRVHEIDVANVRVANERVVYVDDGDEIMAATEPGKERFAEAQREPADSETKPAAEEANKSGAIDWRPKERARAPSPSAREIVPAAIVEGSEAPRRIINPSPAPGVDPVPIAIAVRSPVRRNITRIPNVAVFRFIAPVTVIIQIAVARRIAGNVLSGNRVVFLQVALRGPAVEAVRTRSLFNVGLNVVCAIEFGALTEVNFIGFAAGGHFALAANYRHASGVAVFIHVDAKCSGLLDSESQIRGVHFVEIAFTQLGDAEIDATLGKAHLRDALIEIEERERSCCRDGWRR